MNHESYPLCHTWHCSMDRAGLYGISLRASDEVTPLKLFLLMELNRPVRNLLVYILRHEQETQISDVRCLISDMILNNILR